MEDQGPYDQYLISSLAHFRRRFVSHLLVVLTSACSMFSFATETQAVVASGSSESVELYQAPRVLKSQNPNYPRVQLRSNGEGWVVMQYMVDTTGKPYEISVVDSIGSEDFAKSAIRAMEQFTFQPAMANGQPIDAGGHHKIVFSLAGGATGAKSRFVRTFRKLSKAINASDKAKADALFAELKITNLYEDAFYNYLRTSYYAKWGTPQQSLAAVRRAVAHEESDTYLQGPQYLSALQLRFALEAKLNDFAAAEKTAALLLEHEKDEDQLAIVKNALKQIGELRNTSQSYTVTANLGDRTSWWFNLFRNKFQVSVVEGRIAELKLRCRKGYVFFRYDPELAYSVPKDQMPCGLEVLGDPGTEFKIGQ